MTLRIFYWLALGWALSGPLWALSIKVVEVDYKRGWVTVLLPMHHAVLEVSLLPEESEVHVRKREFYEAEIVPGAIGTTGRSLLQIKARKGRPVLFRIRKVKFLNR